MLCSLFFSFDNWQNDKKNSNLSAVFPCGKELFFCFHFCPPSHCQWHVVIRSVNFSLCAHNITISPDDLDRIEMIVSACMNFSLLLLALFTLPFFSLFRLIT